VNRSSRFLGLSLLLTTLVVEGSEEWITSDKTTSYWKNYFVTLNHQFEVNVPFDILNEGLCVFSKQGLSRFTNLAAQTEIGEAAAYATNVAEQDCARPNVEREMIVRSMQKSPDSPLQIDLWFGFETTALWEKRRRLTLTEEVNELNPLAVLSYQRELWDKASNYPVLRWSSDSTRLDDGRIHYQSFLIVDDHVVNQAVPINNSEEVYGTSLFLSENGQGHGTVLRRYFGNPWGTRFPAGKPFQVSAVNLAFDDKLLLYEKRAQFSAGVGWVEESGLYKKSCVSRTDFWTYIPWFGYGVYDREGNRISEPFRGTFVDDQGEQVPFVQYGDAYIVGEGPLICRSMKDGSVLPIESCINSSEPAEIFLDLVNIPDRSLVTRTDTGEQYIVRVLRVRRTYQELPLDACGNLQLPETLPVPNHHFLEGKELRERVPPAGAVLLNEFANLPEQDPIFAGKSYDPFKDDDLDEVLNYLDAFPEDDQRAFDLDRDGIEDEVDEEDNRFIANHDAYLWPNVEEVITPLTSQLGLDTDGDGIENPLDDDDDGDGIVDDLDLDPADNSVPPPCTWGASNWGQCKWQ
jgi:hypothetical protein